MQQLTPQSDAELVALSIEGDQAAFAAIYDRYADRLHSYCFVMLRDTHSAADAMHDTFVKAATRLSQLRDPAKLRPWLFAIARNEAHAVGRNRSKQDLVEDLSQELVSEPDPSLGLAQAELKELVWSAVAGLQERDRELMTLSLVEGLEGSELAQAMGVKDSHLHVMLTRMRDRVEKALGALLVARQGRDDCDDLADLLHGWDGHFNLDIRSKVTRHVESCDVCSQNRALLASPAALLSSVVFIPAPAALRGSVLRDSNTALAAAKTYRLRSSKHVRWAIGSVAAGVVLLVGGVAASAFLTETGTTEIAAVSLTSSSSTTTPAPTTTTPIEPVSTSSTSSTTTQATTTTPVPPSTPTPPNPPPLVSDLTLGSATIDFGTTGDLVTVELSNVGQLPTSWKSGAPGYPFAVSPSSGLLDPGESVTVAVSMARGGVDEGSSMSSVSFSGQHDSTSLTITGRTEIAPAFLRPVARPNIVRIPSSPICGAALSTISVIVTDDSPIESVIIGWGPTGGSPVTSPMTPAGNGVYVASVGPFYIQGDVSPTITATDSRGNSASTTAELFSLACS